MKAKTALRILQGTCGRIAWLLFIVSLFLPTVYNNGSFGSYKSLPGWMCLPLVPRCYPSNAFLLCFPLFIMLINRTLVIVQGLFAAASLASTAYVLSWFTDTPGNMVWIAAHCLSTITFCIPIKRGSVATPEKTFDLIAASESSTCKTCGYTLPTTLERCPACAMGVATLPPLAQRYRLPPRPHIRAAPSSAEVSDEPR